MTEESTNETRKCEYSQTNAFPVTLKSQVFAVLDKYPNASPKEICRLLNINYSKKEGTVRGYKYQYKKMLVKNRRVLSRLKQHNVRYFGYALKSLDRTSALTVGWKPTKSKSKMITWKDRIGRIEWFPTGRLNCWIRKPATPLKCKQLLANAFFKTGLVFDINIFTEWTDGFRLKGFDLVLDTGEVLPYARIDILKDSTGIIVTTGDASHRTGIEIQVILPDWRERQEQLQEHTLKVLEDFGQFMKDLSTPKPRKKGDPLVI